MAQNNLAAAPFLCPNMKCPICWKQDPTFFNPTSQSAEPDFNLDDIEKRLNERRNGVPHPYHSATEDISVLVAKVKALQTDLVSAKYTAERESDNAQYHASHYKNLKEQLASVEAEKEMMLREIRAGAAGAVIDQARNMASLWKSRADAALTGLRAIETERDRILELFHIENRAHAHTVKGLESVEAERDSLVERLADAEREIGTVPRQHGVSYCVSMEQFDALIIAEGKLEAERDSLKERLANVELELSTLKASLPKQ